MQGVLVWIQADAMQGMCSGDAEVAWQVESLAKRLKLKLYRTCVSENLNVDKVRQAVPTQRIAIALPLRPTASSCPYAAIRGQCRVWPRVLNVRPWRRRQVFEYLGEQYVNGPSEPELPAPSQTPAAATSAASPPAPLSAPASKTSEESKDPAPAPPPAAGRDPFPALLAPRCRLLIPPISAPACLSLHALQLSRCSVRSRTGVWGELLPLLAVRV